MTILLVPIHIEADHQLNRLCALLEARFGAQARISRAGLDARPFFDPNRRQYSSSAIIEQLERDFPGEESIILAVAGLDLFIPILSFVFGEARLNGRCAVVSSYRLDNRFYGLPENPRLMHERLFKEAIHELGHTFGLVHCLNPECVMKSSTYVEEIDYKSSQFCKHCRDLMTTQR